MNRTIKAIPNTLTCCNLLCGCFAIYSGISGDLMLTFWLIIAAAMFDFFDGFAARMLKAYSPIGADLDSLADVVSFGVAPAMTVFSILTSNLGDSSILTHWISFGAFLLAVFAALRLAKFNIDTRQTEEFIGLPTPAMALFFVSYAVSYNRILAADSVIFPYLTLALVVLFCFLMVSEIPMFSFKFKNFGFRQNALRYFFAVFSVLSVVLLGYAAPAVIVPTYVIVSLIRIKSAN